MSPELDKLLRELIKGFAIGGAVGTLIGIGSAFRILFYSRH